MLVLSQRFPNWKDLAIHESSPGGRGASVKLSRECRNYIPSQFFERLPLGETYAGCRCENLEQLTFADDSIGIHVTQDVMEHILRPYRAFSEIARTLKPGGAHVFTVPLVRRHMPSVRRACPAGDGIITYLVEAEYHGNPISEQGSLVTTDWGYDIVKHIYVASGLVTEIFHIDCLDYGIRAEYIEVLVTYKDLEIFSPFIDNF